ncbi:MAG: carboxylating nicotinate-nucleotide diphosphorylase [Candidatus Sumerlaeaceae bacterium]
MTRKSHFGLELRELVKLALAEDLGSGDVTSAIFNTRLGTAYFLAKEDGCMSGGHVVREVFRQLDPKSRFRQLVQDGTEFRSGARLAEVEGKLAALLSGERTALNFLQRLCGIASLTREYVRALGRYADRIAIFDTRKTTPLLRVLEKKAVVDGGGQNHRFGLFDMVMIKNNHVDAAGSISQVMRALIEQGEILRRRLPICIEARTTEEALEALAVGADIIMLDNMAPSLIRKCVAQLRKQADALGLALPEIEVSGRISPEDVRALRMLPIQRISVGRLTHSARALDISMRIEAER